VTQTRGRTGSDSVGAGRSATTKQTYISLRVVLSDAVQIDLFAEYLVGELSTECLTSVIELMQWRDCVMAAFNIPSDTDTFKRILFADGVPRSDIVFADDKTPTETGFEDILIVFKAKAHRLFLKYVLESSDYEINLSYGVRGELKRLMLNQEKWMGDTNDMDSQTLMRIFDPAICGMMQLLGFAKVRFLLHSAN